MKFLLFDLDNTLIPSDEAYLAALRAVGVTQFDDGRFQDARTLVKAALPKGHVAARNRLLYFKAMLKSEKPFSASKILDLMTSYEAALESFLQEWVKVSGRVDVLEQLLGFADGFILTNENLRTQLLKVRALGSAGQKFKGMVTSEEVGYEKPHLQIFQHALRTFELNPADVIMVGDDVENDILPALKLGMTCVLTEEFVKTSAHIPAGVLRISHLSELESLLK